MANVLYGPSPPRLEPAARRSTTLCDRETTPAECTGAYGYLEPGRSVAYRDPRSHDRT